MNVISCSLPSHNSRPEYREMPWNRGRNASIVTVEQTEPPTGEELRSELVDLTGVELSELSRLDDTAFSRALRRVRDEAHNPPHSVASFEAII